MQVKVKLKFSDWAAVLSGVPRGSVLGPLLFLIFVNNLPLWMPMFADDTKVGRKISNENDGALLERLIEWSKDCHLDFNFQR